MSLFDALNTIKAEKPEKGKAAKKYVAFTIEEWSELEKAYGKTIDPVDVKKLIQAIFGGTLDVRPIKKAV